MFLNTIIVKKLVNRNNVCEICLNLSQITSTVFCKAFPLQITCKMPYQTKFWRFYKIGSKSPVQEKLGRTWPDLTGPDRTFLHPWFSPKRAHLYCFRYLGVGSSCCLRRNLTFYENDQLYGVYMFLYEKKKCQSEVKNLEEILFGYTVCANGPAVNKITRKPFVVTLNSKTENKNFAYPLQFLQKR